MADGHIFISNLLYQTMSELEASLGILTHLQPRPFKHSRITQHPKMALELSLIPTTFEEKIL